ncbi:ATP-binding cassette domain-containing protein [Pedosphaera parvula]|uniref:ABC transporter related-protein n=1 Tax=Pedosphaera parvula (strain Ellin514) TaxID=320771 RepID=B9XK63_PEDPL|nr:ATP-binding cassette domain-containing protein [Pedosphaera parvula]EEF59701.1 ABC transporter related-protein [Pedosphaera parvula Ellin514]
MAERNPPLIQLRGVGEQFGTVWALQAIDLDIERGKTTVLIGPSGCGKSTILRLIIGLLQATSGTVEFEGKPVSSANILELRRRMGYVIQDGGLFPHLTARDNVVLMARHLGRDREAVQRRLKELCALTRFPEEGLERYPVELSGGQRQRVSLMRGLMLNPDVLLLDEPLGALDPMVRFALQTELKEIFQQLKQTIVMVTHDMAEAAYFGDTIVLMKQGRIVQQGTLADLRERPADPFVSEFLNAQRGLAPV